MPTTLRITTFNVENLFNRYAFLDLPWDQRHYEQFVEATGVVSIASRQGDLVSYAITELQRNNTALAILDAQPDILAVQEIENIYTLRNFNDEYLDNYFDRALSIDGNDLRGIDVGLLIKKERKDSLVDVIPFVANRRYRCHARLFRLELARDPPCLDLGAPRQVGAFFMGVAETHYQIDVLNRNLRQTFALLAAHADA